jgi:hypothetical protein
MMTKKGKTPKRHLKEMLTRFDNVVITGWNNPSDEKSEKVK